MSDLTIAILLVIKSFGDLIFWAFMVVAIWKYNVFGYLPKWLRLLLVTGIGLSGIAGLIATLL